MTTSCQTDAARSAQVTVSDSAGIRLVALPVESRHPATVVVQLDTSWPSALSRELGELLDVEVLPDGRVALLERFAAEVIVLGTSGAVDAAFGAPGEGPGELEPRGLSRIVATDSSLWVPDLIQQRLTEFSFDGRLLGNRPFPLMGAYAVDWRWHPRGGLAFRVLEQNGDRLVHLHEGRLDTLHAFPPMEAVPNLLLAPVPLWDVWAGVLVLGRSDRWSVETRELGSSGRPLWIARREGEAPPFTEQDRAALEEVLMASVARDAGGGEVPPEARERVLRQVTFPTLRPRIAGLRLAENGDVWVRRAVEVGSMDRDALRVGSAVGYGGTDWDVLTAGGDFRATVRFPPDFEVTRLTPAWIYGIARDELGVPRPARASMPRFE